MTKRTAVAVLAVGMALLIAACGGADSGPTTSTESPSTVAPSSTSVVETELSKDVPSAPVVPSPSAGPSTP